MTSSYRDTTFVHFLKAAVLSSSALLLWRMLYTGDLTYVFLWWNLFLAWVPYGIAGTLEAMEDRKGQPLAAVAPIYVAWLLFFPNAPYILTDFIHLDALTGAVPLWYDALLVGSFGVSGLAFGLKSLHLVHRSVGRRFGAAFGWAMVAAVGLLSGFGVYLGRFPRWNSWDILVNPLHFAKDISHRLTYPSEYPKLIEVTLLFAVLVLGSYLGYLVLRKVRPGKKR
jgi:uncharacterized membrane protein